MQARLDRITKEILFTFLFFDGIIEKKRSRGKILIFLWISDQAEDGNPNITMPKPSLWTASP